MFFTTSHNLLIHVRPQEISLSIFGLVPGPKLFLDLGQPPRDPVIFELQGSVGTLEPTAKEK